MSRDTEASDRLSEYLLGGLSESETEAVEREYFTRADSFDALAAAEDELIDDYVEGRLAEADRSRFEERILAAPGGRARVELARTLFERAGREELRAAASRPSALRRGLLAASVVVALVGAGAWVAWSRQVARERAEARSARQAAEQRESELSSRLARLEREAEAQQSRIARLTEELALERLSGPAARVISIVLTPGLERGTEEPVRVTLPAGIADVQVRLLLERDPYPSYSASVETPEGRQAARRDGLRSTAVRSGRAVDVVLPARLLAPGTYVVILRGGRPAAASQLVQAYHLQVASAP